MNVSLLVHFNAFCIEDPVAISVDPGQTPRFAASETGSALFAYYPKSRVSCLQIVK